MLKHWADLLFCNGLAVVFFLYQRGPYVWGNITSILLLLSCWPRLIPVSQIHITTESFFFFFVAIVTGWNMWHHCWDGSWKSRRSRGKKNPINFSLTILHNMAEAFEIKTAIRHQYLAQSHPQSLLAEVFIVSSLYTPCNTVLAHVGLSVNACQFITIVTSVNVVLQCKHLERIRFLHGEMRYIVIVLYISVLLSKH